MYAVCVYAGTQTKISLNSKITKNKFSSIERSLNKYKTLVWEKRITCTQFWNSFSFFFTQVPDSLRLDSAHRDDRQVWFKEISQENKSDIFVNSSTVFSFTLDYEYFKGTDLYLFRWQPHMFPIPISSYVLIVHLFLKNTVRDGGSTALYTAYTVHSVHIVYTVLTA